MQLIAFEDSFIITQFSAAPLKENEKAASVHVSTWSAVRKGPSAFRKQSDAATGPGKTMLQRYGPYLVTALAFLVYKVAKEGATKEAGKK